MYTKRYTPPTCTLELTAKKSPVINTGEKPWEFNLRLDDPRLPEQEHITITGDRTQLNSLHDAVNNYIQKFLAYPAVENIVDHNLVNNSALTVQQHFAIPDHADIYLQPRNLLIHDLCLGKLTTNQAIASIPLSVLQLFDLSTVLNECQTDLVTELEEVHQSLPSWLKSAGLILLTAGLTALAIKGYDYYVTSQKPTPVQQAVTMPNIPSPSPVAITPKPTPKISPTVSPSPLPKSLKPSPIPVPPTLFGGPGNLPMSPPNFPNQSGSLNNQFSSQNDDRMVMVIPTDETNNPGDRRSVLTIDAPTDNVNSVPFVPPPAPVVSPPLPVPPIPPPNLGINLTPTTSIAGNNPILPSREYLDVKQLPIMMPGQIDLPVLTDREEIAINNIDDGSNNSPDNLADNLPKKSQSTDKFPEEPLIEIVEPENSQPREYVAEKNTLFDQIPQVSQVRGYFEEKWQPPADLTKSLQYNLTIDQAGKVQTIKPVGETAVKYSKQAKLPEIGEVITSNLTNTQLAKIRVVLQPDGKVQTFLY